MERLNNSTWTPHSSPISSDSGYLTSVESRRRHSVTLLDTSCFKISDKFKRLTSIDMNAPSNSFDDDNELQHQQGLLFNMSMEDISALTSSPSSASYPRRSNKFSDHDAEDESSFRNPITSLSLKVVSEARRHSGTQTFSSYLQNRRHDKEEVKDLEMLSSSDSTCQEENVREVITSQLLPDILPQFEILARTEDSITSEHLSIREAAAQLRQVGDEFQLSHSPARAFSSNHFVSRPISISRNANQLQPVQQAQSLIERAPSEGRNWMRRFSLPPGSLSVTHLFDRWLGENN